MSLKKPESERWVRFSICMHPGMVKKLKEEAAKVGGGYVSPFICRLVEAYFENPAILTIPKAP